MLLLKTTVFRRLKTSFTHIPEAHSLYYAALCIIIYAFCATYFALTTRFVTIESPPPAKICFQITIVSFFAPSLLEEIVFRAILLPHRKVDGCKAFKVIPRILYHAISIGGFVVYHLSPFHEPQEVFSNWRFLVLAGMLGLVCVVVYLKSGSIWLPVFIHYVTVIVWLLFFGGYSTLHQP